jgi:hypothetical protein
MLKQPCAHATALSSLKCSCSLHRCTAHDVLKIVCVKGETQGGKLMKCIQIRNVSRVMRRLRLLPPASQFFHLSQCSFPTSDGLVAPGMAATAVVRFTPDTNANVHDEVTVDTELSRFTVPLMAVRQAPVLSLLSGRVDCGYVYTDEAKQEIIQVKGLQGRGVYKVFAADQWAKGATEILKDGSRHASRTGKINTNSTGVEKMLSEGGALAGTEGVGSKGRQQQVPVTDHCKTVLRHQHLLAAVTAGCFSLYPHQFTLHQGQHMELLITFAPKEAGMLLLDPSAVLTWYTSH